jgi:hypothetical protein
VAARERLRVAREAQEKREKARRALVKEYDLLRQPGFRTCL